LSLFRPRNPNQTGGRKKSRNSKELKTIGQGYLTGISGTHQAYFRRRVNGTKKQWVMIYFTPSWINPADYWPVFVDKGSEFTPHGNADNRHG
jgi:hypothetical protein